MALAKIAKINIIGHQKNQNEFIESLQDVGFIQIDDNYLDGLTKENLNERIAEFDYKLAGIKFSLDFLTYYKTTKKTLAERLDPKIELSQTALESIIKNFDVQKKVDEIQEVEKELNEAQNVIDKLQTEKQLITPWLKLSFIPNLQDSKSHYTYKFGIIDHDAYLNFINHLQKEIVNSAVEKIDEQQKDCYLAIFYPPDAENKINEALNEYGAKTVELPKLEVLIRDRLKEIYKIIENKQKILEKMTHKAQALADDQKNLKVAFDYVSWQKERLTQAQKAGRTDQTFSLIGWIDKTKIPAVEKELNKIDTDFAIEELTIDQEESVPIIFKNSWARSFEAVTNVYGAPMYHEPDPTPFLTPFFILFFSLCLTDAGYGIILALASFIGLKFLKPTDSIKKMLKVLFWGGLATFFAGALVGGWFGIVIDEIKTDWLRNTLVSLRAIDPVKDPISMLIFSLVLGIIQVIVGILVSLWWKIKNKNYISAVLDDVMWLFFVGSLLTWGSSKVGLLDWPGSVYLIWAATLGIILTQGRSNKNPILKVLTGIISLYGVVGYLSDVLSYSRLLALGLATGIIAMVINLIAGLAIELVPYAGWVIAGIILIGGHIFNLAINALGAFIHSSRLQFVEFFPKFMEGGGQIFQPFAKESKFIRINNSIKK